MKTHRLISPALIASCISLLAQAPPGVSPASSETPVVVQAGPHFAVWQGVSLGVDDQGQPVAITNSWTEVATGLNWLNPATGQYEPSVEAFEITPKGYAVALRGQT